MLFSADYPALVVKASGLAAGKGVIVSKSKDEACQAVIDMLQVTIDCIKPTSVILVTFKSYLDTLLANCWIYILTNYMHGFHCLEYQLHCSRYQKPVLIFCLLCFQFSQLKCFYAMLPCMGSGVVMHADLLSTHVDRQGVDILVTIYVFVRLRISPPKIKLAESNFAWWFIGVQGRESPIVVNFAPPEAKIGRIGEQRAMPTGM